MKLAIMQPYFFPYVGYWQLLRAVDRFVIYDDVNYIKGGWVNRNRILINGKPSYITAFLNHASQNKLICDISMQSSPVWRNKMINSISCAYKRAPYYSKVITTIEKVVYNEMDCLSDFLAYSLRKIATLLCINTEIVTTSRAYGNNQLAGQERILDICTQESASVYINAKGGRCLYNHDEFMRKNIELKFLDSQSNPYTQRVVEFIPNLSIIDGLMEVGPRGMKKYLNNYDLI